MWITGTAVLYKLPTRHEGGGLSVRPIAFVPWYSFLGGGEWRGLLPRDTRLRGGIDAATSVLHVRFGLIFLPSARMAYF